MKKRATTIISEDYRKLNEELHKTNEHYGTSGAAYRHIVREISDWGRLKILDFGCGKRTLSKSLGPAYSVTDFDPCIPGLDTPPVPHPIVVCTDVLEHIEPDLLDNVLGELRRLTQKKALLAAALGPSKKFLADGRNSHLIQEKPEWWEKRLTEAGFKIEKKKDDGKVENMSWWLVT